MNYDETINGVPVRWTLFPADRLPLMESWWVETVEKATKDDMFKSYIEGHTMKIPADFSWAKSIICAAVYAPPRILPFAYRGKKYEIMQPPAYYETGMTRDMVKERIISKLGGSSFRLEDARTPPAKLLAASCGLGKYGRNNIIYVEGMGTAHSLMAFWTDADAGVLGETIQAGKMQYAGPEKVALCNTCSLCVKACPTGAIPEIFGVIDQDRCIPLWNETERPFPACIPVTAHNAVMGCVVCQMKCPANADYKKTIPVLRALSEAETEAVLKGEWSESLRATLRSILSFDDEEGLKAWAPLLKRNLCAFIEAGGVTVTS